MSLDIHSNCITNDYTCNSNMVVTSLTAGCKAMLSRVQRLACVAITGAILTSHTAALEVITRLLLLDIHIKQVAMTTSYRINSLKNWKRFQNFGSHSHIRENIHKEVPLQEKEGITWTHAIYLIKILKWWFLQGKAGIKTKNHCSQRTTELSILMDLEVHWGREMVFISETLQKIKVYH